jgi:hypothetical protein
MLTGQLCVAIQVGCPCPMHGAGAGLDRPDRTRYGLGASAQSGNAPSRFLRGNGLGVN